MAESSFSFDADDYVVEHRIRFENISKGEIKIQFPGQAQWIKIGEVLRPAIKNNPQGYTAAKWAQISKVSATAVNAIHIKTDQLQDKAVVISLLPKDVQDSGKSYFDLDSSVQTDIPAGTLIFGGEYAPWVGNPVYLIHENERRLLPSGYEAQLGDVLEIEVRRARKFPSEIVFENWFGGKVWVQYPGEKPIPIAQVIKPVYGIGRFIGTRFAGLGRIRANHCGVIDISTSPAGEDNVGGFQIIPSVHYLGPEMERARRGTQWMVVGPLKNAPPLEGQAPLFSAFILPSFAETRPKLGDWKKITLRRSLVQARRNSGPWQSLPAYSLQENEELPESSKTWLKEFTHFRILMPVFE